MSMGGGGGTTSTVNQSNLPEYAEPYYTALMERGAKESTRDYQKYGGQRIADMSSATQSGLQMAGSYANSGTPWLDRSAQSVQNVANRAGMMSRYNPTDYNAQQMGFGQGGVDQVAAQQQGFGQNGVNQVGFGQGGYNEVGFGQNGLSQLGFGQGGINQVGTSGFNNAAAQQYMSPYMDAVTNKAQSDAVQNAAEAQATRNLQAARSGSFGGSRAAVQNSIANTALQSNLTDIMVKGQQSAFENAQSQFNTDQSRQLQAAIQNQNTGLNMGQSNQNAALQVGQNNQSNALQALLANQQAGLTMGGQNQDAALRAGMANQQTGLAMGQANQGAALDAAKLREQSSQFGKQLGLQGLELQNKAGMDLATLQTQRDDAMLNRIKAQLGVGSTREDYKQQRLDQRYNDFVNQRDSERQNLQFLSSLLQGVPVSANTDITQSQGQNNLQGMLGSAGGLQALYSLGNKS